MRKHIEFVDRSIEISDKEIESYMDFDSLLERDKMHKIRNQIESKITRKLFWLVTAALLIGTTSYFLLQEDSSGEPITKLNSSEKTLNQFEESIPEVVEEEHSNDDSMDSTNKIEPKRELPVSSESLVSKFKNERKDDIEKQPNGLNRSDKLENDIV